MLRSDFVFSGAVQVPSLVVKRTLCADSRVRVFEERPVGLLKIDCPRDLMKPGMCFLGKDPSALVSSVGEVPFT